MLKSRRKGERRYRGYGGRKKWKRGNCENAGRREVGGTREIEELEEGGKRGLEKRENRK